MQQLDSVEGPNSRHQRLSLENWVWAFGMPTQPCGWPPFFFCILLSLIIELFPYLHANGNFLQAIPIFTIKSKFAH